MSLTTIRTATTAVSPTFPVTVMVSLYVPNGTLFGARILNVRERGDEAVKVKVSIAKSVLESPVIAKLY